MLLAPWLSDQLEWICGMLHGLVINWSSSAIETSRNRVNGIVWIGFDLVFNLRLMMLGEVDRETLGLACGVLLIMVAMVNSRPDFNGEDILHCCYSHHFIPLKICKSVLNDFADWIGFALAQICKTVTRGDTMSGVENGTITVVEVIIGDGSGRKWAGIGRLEWLEWAGIRRLEWLIIGKGRLE
ncbi:hypothetical protein Tco_0511271 [Tanacetum coccineum]